MPEHTACTAISREVSGDGLWRQHGLSFGRSLHLPNSSIRTSRSNWPHIFQCIISSQDRANLDTHSTHWIMYPITLDTQTCKATSCAVWDRIKTCKTKSIILEAKLLIRRCQMFPPVRINFPPGHAQCKGTRNLVPPMPVAVLEVDGSPNLLKEWQLTTYRCIDVSLT